jgi:hypothetical protein
MKRYFWPIYLLLSMAGAAQQPPPTLSTADQIAIRDCEQKKKDAQTQFNEAQQAELAVEREWQAAHPGYHLTASFTIEADKPAAKTETPKERK